MKWRELRYYAHGTPTKTTIRHRRRHSFKKSVFQGYWKSLCGLHVTAVRFSKGPTEAQKCKHCVKIQTGVK